MLKRGQLRGLVDLQHQEQQPAPSPPANNAQANAANANMNRMELARSHFRTWICQSAGSFFGDHAAKRQFSGTFTKCLSSLLVCQWRLPVSLQGLEVGKVNNFQR